MVLRSPYIDYRRVSRVPYTHYRRVSRVLILTIGGYRRAPYTLYRRVSRVPYIHYGRVSRVPYRGVAFPFLGTGMRAEFSVNSAYTFLRTSLVTYATNAHSCF